jgi:hypothetical protein
MATYNITVPVVVAYDFQVEAPEGATREEVMAMVSEQNIKEGEFYPSTWKDADFFFRHEGGKDVEVGDEDFNEVA